MYSSLLFVICLGPVCIPIWGLLPILFTLFPSIKKYIVGEQSPQWLRTCLCLKKETSKDNQPSKKNLPKLTEAQHAYVKKQVLDATSATESGEAGGSGGSAVVVRSRDEYYHLLSLFTNEKYDRNVVVQWSASWYVLQDKNIP